MKLPLLSIATVILLAACDAHVDVPPAQEDKTTIVNPPAQEKKIEHTTVVTPPAEKK